MLKRLFILAPAFLISPQLTESPFPTQKMDSHVQKAYFAKQPIDVIVQLKEQADLSAAETITNRTARIQYVYDQLRVTAQKSQAALVTLLRERQAQFQPFYITNAIAIPHANASLLQTLSKVSNVEAIVYDKPTKMELPKLSNFKDEAPAGVETSLTFIKADQVWNAGFKGQGIVIAGQDTGYAWEHPAIKGRYRGNGETVDHNYNWHDSIHKGGGKCGADAKAPCDDHYHGTHTMGTMLGEVGNNKIGVAPEAKWIGCRNMDEGVGTPSTYLECFEFFLAPYPVGGNPQTDGKAEMAPHIISNSWGCPDSEGCSGGEFVDAIKALHAAGIMVVVAAGNEGPGCKTIGAPPAIYTDIAVVIAAHDHRTNSIASFSSRGPSSWANGVGPDFAAPGVNIRSCVPGGGYYSLSGTSMATPHVAGAVALLWSAKPNLVGNVAETVKLLRGTSTPRTSSQNCGQFPGSAIPNAVYGYGVMDIYKAVMTN